jgi:hypothetical protein
MAVAVARHLPHFAVNTLDGADFGNGFRPLAEAAEVGPPAEQADALANARDEAMVVARAEFERIRAADLAEHERLLEERERQFAETTGGVLLGQLSDGLARIESVLGGHVARVLARFLDHAVRERALAELSETVAALMVGGGAVPLVSRLRELLDAAATASIECAVGAKPEVTVTIDDTIIETQIAAWMERVRTAIEGEARG